MTMPKQVPVCIGYAGDHNICYRPEFINAEADRDAPHMFPEQMFREPPRGSR